MIVSMESRRAKKPCGCAAGRQCGCHSAVCESQCEIGFSRPNFFAGQLLTDEDLQAMLNYVIEKNRLHNRNVLGEGVVCGLEVRHHPCPDKQRKVVIQPGHALDCCGNDIVVPCAEELDIVKMVHELRTKLRGGHDCGDPCREKPALFVTGFGEVKALDGKTISDTLRETFEDNGHPLPQEATVVVIDVGREWRIGGTIQYRLRKGPNALHVYRAGDEEKTVFNLHVRYREVGFDPVSPYQVEEGCQTACQPSRMRETYCFELSCDEPVPEVGLRDRLKNCNDAVPGYAKMQAETLHGARALETAEKVLIQFLEIERLLQLPGDGADNPLKELHAAIDRITLPAVNPQPTVEEQVTAAAAVHRLLTLSLRAFHEPIKDKVPPALKTKIRSVFLPAVKNILIQLPTVQGNTGTEEFPFAVEIPVIELLKTRAGALEKALDSGVAGHEFDEKAQIVGELITLEMLNGVVRRLDEIDEELKRLVRAGSIVVDRELRHLMDGIDLQLFLDMSQHLKTAKLLQIVKDQVAVVSRAVAEISRRCLCEIVLPPCPPCDDARVLIAALTVENCDVTDICNVKRKMVITGPSINYWFSNFGILDRIRASCCPTPDDLDRAKLKEVERLRQQHEEWKKALAPSDVASRPVTPDLRERTNNPDQWERLGAFAETEPVKLEWSAIEPASFRLSRELRPGEQASPQFINEALSQLASRPATDIRGILDLSGDTKSAGQVERELGDKLSDLEANLETQIGSAIDASSQANSKASAADAKAQTADAKASALEVHFKPTGRVGELEKEFEAGGRVNDLEAHFSAGGRVEKLEGEFIAGGRVKALEDEVDISGVPASRIDTAEFDHDGNAATPAKTVQALFEAIRTKLDALSGSVSGTIVKNAILEAINE